MPIETIGHKGNSYPKFQSEGNAAKFIIPFAQQVCKGQGFDIGCGKIEWSLPGSIPIDPALNLDDYHAMKLPNGLYDYIFSSHCLEHIPDCWKVLDYWRKALRNGGVLFLYLPHPDQSYWLPWHNSKHVNVITPFMIERYLHDNGYINIFVSQRDLNHSFAVMAQKCTANGMPNTR